MANDIIYGNTTMNGVLSNYDSAPSILVSCCTTPMPPSGFNNITNDADFIGMVNGNFRLQTNSPCINAGNNTYMSNSLTAVLVLNTDLDGNPRIVGGAVDIGAYEFQSPTSIISYAWLQQYGLPTDGSADHADIDGDGMNNYQESIAGTNPTNAMSVLTMLPPTPTYNPPGLVVSWQSIAGQSYFVQRSTNLGIQPAFHTFGLPHITVKQAPPALRTLRPQTTAPISTASVCNNDRQRRSADRRKLKVEHRWPFLPSLASN